MGLVQTNLTDDEQNRFNEVKDFLFDKKLIEKNSVYAAVKWMIIESCNDISKIMVTMQRAEEIVSEEPTPAEVRHEDTAMLHGKEIPVISAPVLPEEPITSQPEPVTVKEPEPKKVSRYVIGGIDFRPRG